MCGLAGLIIYDSPMDKSLLESMGQLIEHRGPDQSGVFVDQQQAASIGLATRRLKILDLSSAGDQPMSNQTGDLWIAYNGEIYNYPSLRKELMAAGYSFRSKTDTEVLLHDYGRSGLDFISHLNGMFAFALYDRVRQLMIIARDRMGIKPLYYWWDGTRLAFASELKALLVCPWIQRNIDLSALQLYLSLGYVPSPHSMIAGIKKLPAGSSLVINLARHEVTECRYWDPPPATDLCEGKRETVLLQETRQVIEDAVSRQMMSDVPVGSLLSGGVDSTVITALAQRHHGGMLDTFSVGYEAPPAMQPFDSAYNDDLHYARLASKCLGTRHHEIMVPAGKELADLVATVVRGLDEPIGEATAVAQHLVSRLARETGTIVLLTGDGGDELFAGYPWYTVARRLELYEKVPFLSYLLPMIERLAPTRSLRAKAIHLAGRLNVPDVRKYCHFFNIPTTQELREFLAPSVSNSMSQGLVEGELAALLQERKSNYFPEQLAWVDLAWWIRDIFNHRLDRMSMANSVEARVPFLDNEVVDFALSIPIDRKMPGGRRKHLLLKAFEEVLPREIRAREKRPFVGPCAYWLQGGLRELALDTLAGPEIDRVGFLNPATARAVVNRFCLEGEGDPLVVWRLLMFQIWCREYGVRQ